MGVDYKVQVDQSKVFIRLRRKREDEFVMASALFRSWEPMGFGRAFKSSLILESLRMVKKAT